MRLWWIFLNVLFLDNTSGLRNEINGKPLHHHMTKREIEQYFGIKDDAEVPEYDIAIPYESNTHGHFVSYKLHEKRSRRNAENSDADSHYVKMDALGKTMHLKLTQNDQFMAPGLTAETRHSDGTITAVPVSRKNFFLGKLTSDANSLVAVRKDKGLTGMIRDKDDTMYVHPLPDHLAKHFKTKRDTQPHLIFKGSQDIKREVKCQTIDSAVNIQKRSSLMKQSTDSSNVTHKYLEAALVADDDVAKLHGNGTFQYLLLLGHMMNAIFHDNTVGDIKITYIVTRLAIVSLKELEVQTNSSNGAKLDAIVAWGRKNNVRDDTDPLHFEVVSLVSRSSGGGLAYLGGVCSRDFGSNVNGDYGLQTMQVLAHETAHSMGFGHDGGREDCPDGRNVMSSGMTGGMFSLKWSPCTKESIQQWLQSPGSSCLDDVPPSSRPKYPSVFYEKLPGQIVNGDQQCQYQYGEKYFHCPFKKSTCSTLWCTSNGSGCTSSMPPPVDGTACGPRHWCISGECVDNGGIRIDGGWSEWSAFSSCSQSCGGGVKYRTRTCTNPSPENDGENCVGDPKGQWAICNSEECPTGGPSFRDIQCHVKAGSDYKAYYVSDPCTLACIRGSYYYKYGWVNDGIRCSSDIFNYDVCIQGKCRSVGCDHGLESGTRKDRCGICGGNGDSCVLVKSAYTKNHQIHGFENADIIVELPVGTTGAFFKKRDYNWNYLGVRDKNGTYVINLPSYSRTVNFAGTKIAYRRESSQFDDSIKIEGPTNDIVQIVFAFLYNKPVGVDYHYWRPRVNGEEAKPTTFEWKTEDWKPCPVKCATGTQIREVRCIRSDDKTTANTASCDAAVKPTNQRPCNMHPCEPEWHETDWQKCSRSCGKGSQARFLLCRRQVNQAYHEILTNTSCNATQKPADRLSFRLCNLVSCPPQWRPLPWSKCSTTCGSGIKTRGVQCMKTNEDGADVVIPDELCKHKASDIPQQEKCNEDKPCTPPPEIEIGCFIGNPLKEELGDFTANLDWEHTDVVAAKCAQLAHNKGYKYFALGNNGICFSGVNAKTEYFTGGSATLTDCMNGIGRSNSIFVYSLEPLPQVEPLGCYYDSESRALPVNYISVRDQILWKSPELTVRQCADVARNLGYQYFAVQYYGECWAGPNGGNTYSKHGKAPDGDCWNGVGAGYRNSVYRFN